MSNYFLNYETSWKTELSIVTTYLKFPALVTNYMSTVLSPNSRLTMLLNPLNPELNPICYLLALLRAHHFLHVSRMRVKLSTFRLLMSYIYGAPILDVSRSHTTQHSQYDSSGRVISLSQRPQPDNTQHSQQTNVHAPGGIRTHDLSRRVAADLRLRLRGHWDLQYHLYVHIFIIEDVIKLIQR